jgi:RNA polymerase sigma factor (sigma-70 family)
MMEQILHIRIFRLHMLMNFVRASFLQTNITNICDMSDFYLKNHRWLMSWLYKKTGCSFDAADLAQDTFIKVATSQNIELIESPRAYLTTTATRLIIDLVRKRNIEHVYLESLYLSQSSIAVASPEQIKTTVETLNEIASLLEGLPEKVYHAFLMCRLDGLTYAEIAQELGVSTSMVKQYIARAMMHCYKVIYSE